MFGLRSLKNSTVLVIVTVITILTSLINLVGKNNIKDKVYQFYVNTPFACDEFAELRALKKERSDVNKQRNGISAQDNYAKWIKLNRLYDKYDAEVKDQEKKLTAKKASIDAKIDKVIGLCTTVPSYLVKLWYSRVPLLYLPYGLFPAVLETFVLNIPFLPRGSIGVVVWTYCVSSVLNFLTTFGKYLFTAAPLQPVPVQKKAQ